MLCCDGDVDIVDVPTSSIDILPNRLIEFWEISWVRISFGDVATIPSRMRVRLKFDRVFFSVMQKPLDAGIRGNSGRIWLSEDIISKSVIYV